MENFTNELGKLRILLDGLGAVVYVLQLDLRVVRHDTLQNHPMVGSLEGGCEDGSHLHIRDVLHCVVVADDRLVEVFQILHEGFQRGVVVGTVDLEPELLWTLQVGDHHQQVPSFLKENFVTCHI